MKYLLTTALLGSLALAGSVNAAPDQMKISDLTLVREEGSGAVESPTARWRGFAFFGFRPFGGGYYGGYRYRGYRWGNYYGNYGGGYYGGYRWGNPGANHENPRALPSPQVPNQ